jgi:hypothetical protein
MGAVPTGRVKLGKRLFGETKMILHTAVAWAADLRAASGSRTKAEVIAFLSCAALFLAVVLAWMDGGHSAAVLFVSLALAGLGLIGHAVSVLLRAEGAEARRTRAGEARQDAAAGYVQHG